MKVTIIETGAKASLNIIDPKTGSNWINDLLGNYNALPKYDADTDTYPMLQADYDWWADLIERYQAADDRYYDLQYQLDNDDLRALIEAAESIDVDLDYYPEALQAVCDEFENEDDEDDE